MSGFEIFGAVAAAATLLEVAKKFSARLERYDNVHHDIAALKTRVVDLAIVVDEISVVLSDVRSQQQDGVAAAEVIIWKRMDAVLVLCAHRSSQLDSGLNYVLYQRSKSRLSAVPSDISRRMKEFEDYVPVLILLKGLFQLILQRQQTAAHQSMHRDLAGKMDEIIEGINRINDQHRPVDLLQSEPILDNQTENLGLHLEEIVLAAESFKESFSVPPTQFSSQASVPMSSDGTDFTSITIDNSPDITHVEPLQELAQRFKKQAERDWEYHMYKDAEVHHVESMKCFKELHDAHSISFDDFNNMIMTLADIYRVLRKFFDAKMILKQAAKHPLTYDRELGWRNLLLDVEDNTEHRAQTSHEMAELLLAEFQTNNGTSHLSVDCGKTGEVLLRDAERHAKRAFRIRRNLNEKDHESCKESARLLVDIYNNYTDKSMYAETYNDMYLLDDTTRGPPGSIVRVSAHFDLAEAINDHAISPDDVVSNVDLTDLDDVLDRKSALIVAMDCPKYDQCRRCHIIVDRLLRLGADRNAPFAHAIRKNQISVCKLLLRHGANINWFDARRLTPFMHAVKKGNLEMIRYLLGEQPDINARGYQGQTVLHLAAQTCVDDVFKLLLETAGLDIDATDDNGMTAMHHAAKYDNVIFAKRLGRAKANVEIKDNSAYQRTPLYIAIKEDRYMFVKVLLKWKAKVDLEYLPKTRSSDINSLLRSHQRQVSLEHLSEIKSKKISPKAASFLQESDAVSSATRTGSNWKDVESATTYSLDSSTKNLYIDYLRAFAKQLADDLKVIATKLSDMPPAYIVEALRIFSWKLHEESKDPSQWGVSVALNKNRKNILFELLGQSNPTQPVRYSLDNEDVESDDEGLHRQPHFKSHSEVADWIDRAELGTNLGPVLGDSSEGMLQDVEQQSLTCLADYKVFVESSESYRWLVSRIWQHGRLSYGDPDTKSEISINLRERLRTHESLQKMSHQRPLSKVLVEFILQWHPKDHVEEQGQDYPLSSTLDNILCLTGSWDEAQAMTAADYMRQTWPNTGEAVISLFKLLLTNPGQDIWVYETPGHNNSRLTARSHSPNSCIISVTAGTYYVSEIAEQIAWLAATLQPSTSEERIIARYPRIKTFRMEPAIDGSPTATASVTCEFDFYIERLNSEYQENGACWTSLFTGAILVKGYPILRRLQSRTGLELSLHTMAYLTRSFQVVQYEERIVMKGFSSLLVATLVTTGVAVWHLYGSKRSDERISYFDDRLATLNLTEIKTNSLRDLEKVRHMIGWCSDVDDLCGQKRTQGIVEGSRLPRTPGSIVIDRLYVEGGWYGIVGLNMRLNQREEPTRLMRNLDYPSLLKYFAKSAIVFFDTAERRSWLVDGASALLHLVRSSLQRDQEDEDSPYEWVFEDAELQDTWDGYTSRQAVLNTLKSSNNLNLKLYVIERVERNGQMVENYSTLRDRVLKIAHWLEMLIDAQAYAVSKSKGELKTLQSSDRRKYLTGYDILDVIDPDEPVSTRIARFETWGDGWMDLLPSFNATTIFGKAFGDLIRPKDTASICAHWKTVPTGQDYLCVSVSTLKMLDKRHEERCQPTSKVGELASKLLWTSKSKLFETCRCTAGHLLQDSEQHLDPRQFLESSKPSLTAHLYIKRASSNCVDLGSLQNTGAVVFANRGLFNRKISDKSETNDDSNSIQLPFDSTPRLSAGGTSLTTSDRTHPTGMTDTSNTTEATTTVDSACTNDITAYDTVVVGTVQNQGGAEAMNKGKMRRWVKDFFRKG